MDSDTSRQARESSSSRPTVISVRCKETIELGRKLVRELDLDKSVDTLGRWMAHYIADLIQQADTADPEQQQAKLNQCCEAILNLWEHRYALPDGSRPFENLEPILRALKSLDPAPEKPRYSRLARHAQEEVEETDEAKSWLKVADGLDFSARTFIRYCLAKAAEKTIDKSADWVSAAKSAGVDSDIEQEIIRIVRYEEDIFNPPDSRKLDEAESEMRIEQLEQFVKLASSMLTQLKGNLRDTKTKDSE